MDTKQTDSELPAIAPPRESISPLGNDPSAFPDRRASLTDRTWFVYVGASFVVLISICLRWFGGDELVIERRHDPLWPWLAEIASAVWPWLQAVLWPWIEAIAWLVVILYMLSLVRRDLKIPPA